MSAGRSAYLALPVAIAGVVFANVESLLGDGGGWALAKLAVGLALLAEGLLLASDWRRARREATGLVLRRFGRGRLWRWLLGPALLAFGVVCLGFGVTELIRAAQDAL